MVSSAHNIQQSVRRWVRTVMHQQGWSAEEWARRASTTATNITRILAPDNTSLPNADTLARLASVAGSQPDLVGPNRKVPPTEVPLLDHDQVMELARKKPGERSAYIENLRWELASLQVMFRPSSTGFAIKVETETLRGRGLLKGDVVIIEPADFSGEDVGVAVVAAVHLKRVGAWLWYPPLLVPAHESENPVAIKDAKILGKVMQIMRQL
jgi:SOS-response transcriptional repressor LexA